MSAIVGRPEWRRWDEFKANVFIAAGVFTVGLLPLYCFYNPNVGNKVRTSECAPDHAEFVKIAIDGVEFLAETLHFHSETGEHLVIIEVDCVRYVASSASAYIFARVSDAPFNFARFCDPSYDARTDRKALHKEYCILSAHYGQNLMKIPESGFFEVAFRHIMSPFYIFQYFAAIIWYAENYWLYATLILMITFGAIYLTTKESIFNLESMRLLAGVHNSVKLLNSRYIDPSQRSPSTDIESAAQLGVGRVENVDDSVLVPGDKILIQESMLLPCDAVLISGKVVVDESMLTGESIPVSKTPIEIAGLGGGEPTPLLSGSMSGVARTAGEVDIALQRSGSVLFGGTKVKACYGEQCVAVCYRTSFRSSKGQLVASLLKPRDGFITFVSDALWVLLLMFILTTALYLGVATELVSMGLDAGNVALHYLDAVTIAVPPALTACLTVATAIAINRLKHSEIYVTDTSRVNFAGMISAACFDKTGTLTENSLQFLGAVCTGCILSHEHARGEEKRESQGAAEEESVHKDIMQDFKLVDGRILPLVCQQVMAMCHNLTLLGTGEGSPHGDPLEVELLTACQWSLRTNPQASGQLTAVPPNPSNSVGPCILLKHFEFTPDRLRAATLMKESRTGRLKYLLKGSPETILRLVDPSSVPVNIHKELSNLARKGHRVIAMAFRDCPESEEQLMALTQDELEGLGGLSMAGLLYLSSTLKDDTSKTIQTLKHARIHTNMITGDHIHTAIAIAEQCKLVHSHEFSRSHLQPSAAKTTVTTSPRILPESSRHFLFIIDEDERTGHVTVTDHATDKPVPYSMQEILSWAAQSLFRSVSKRRTDRQSLYASLSTRASNRSTVTQGEDALPTDAFSRERPLTSVDTVDNPLFLEGNSSQRPSLEGLSLSSPHFPQLSSSSPPPPPPPPSPSQSPGPSFPPPSSLSSLGKAPVLELAITGKGLQALRRSHGLGMVKAVIRFAKIFARMKPYDKKYVVESLAEMKEFEPMDLQDHFHGSFADGPAVLAKGFHPVRYLRNFLTTYTSLDIGARKMTAEETAALLETIPQFQVLFCGDGANDMIALRAATVGVSLCDAETSVAAPITSKQQTPASVIEVLKQGRCSLITAYILILFNIMYGIIQLFMACELYSYGLKAGDYMYLIQDLFYTLVLGMAISYSEPSAALSATLPPMRFLSPYFLTKLFLQLALFICFQALALWALSMQGFYDRFETDDPLTSSYAPEASVANNMALAQLMIASIVSSIGEPFRLDWTRNHYHILALCVQSGWLLLQIFIQDSYFFKHILQMKPIPFSFGFLLVVIMISNLAFALAVNMGVDRLFLAKANERWYEKLTEEMIREAYVVPVEKDRGEKSRKDTSGEVGSGGVGEGDHLHEEMDSPGRRGTDRKPLLM